MNTKLITLISRRLANAVGNAETPLGGAWLELGLTGGPRGRCESKHPFRGRPLYPTRTELKG